MAFVNLYITRFLAGYGYASTREFLLSLCPSFKYDIQIPTFSFSLMIASLCHYIGASPIIMLAMLVAVIVETLTGIRASMVRGEHFESFRFSRCILKVFIWISLVFIDNCFSLECSYNSGMIYSVGEVFFDIVKLLILTYFVTEYVVSIMENLAVIDGKEKTAFINALKDGWKLLSDKMSKQVESCK